LAMTRRMVGILLLAEQAVFHFLGARNFPTSLIEVYHLVVQLQERCHETSIPVFAATQADMGLAD
jgi:hypothetical protein